MNGKRRGVTFRNPNPSYRTPAPFYQMIGLLNLTSFKKTLATIATDKLNIHQLPVSVIVGRSNHRGGTSHHRPYELKSAHGKYAPGNLYV